MAYKIEMGVKKFAKMALMTFVAGWATIHGASGSLFTSAGFVPLLEASLLAGFLYSLENYRKHR